jgi:hypothetical protein
MLRFRVTGLCKASANQGPAYARKATEILEHEIEGAVSLELGSQAELV